MQVVHGVRTLASPLDSSVVSIGNFDGVHLGHRELMARLTKEAKARGGPSVVITFDPHPMQVLYPDRQLKRLFDFEDQRQQFEAGGVDMLVVEPFSREFSQLEPDRFVLDYVYRPLNPSHLIVGYDFSFGNSKRGSIDVLKNKGQELGFTLDVVAPIKVDGHLVSSTRVRQALSEGDVVLANLLLGRSFYAHGLVERGAGRGRTIGVPTANIHVGSETIPQGGVYAVWALVDGKHHAGVLNIGTNPTFTAGSPGSPVNVECHLLDFDEDLYGKDLRVEFVQRLRDEKKFGGIQDLVAQIKADIATARLLLKNPPQP